MKKWKTLSFSAALIASLASVVAAQESDGDIRFLPISIGGQFDNGQVVKGKINETDKNSPGTKLNGNFFQRTGVWITQQAIVKERLDITVGVGGVFWYSLPSNPGDPASHLTQFGPGISQAQGVYTFGDLADPTARLQMGFFPYKYNADAKNLGEYLLRSGAYPGYIVSGGWNMIASAAYMVQGMRLNVPMIDDKLQLDFIMAMEHDIPPMYSISPSVVANLKPVPGIALGAGITCNHCISPKPSLEDPAGQGLNQIITGDSVVFDSATATYNMNYTYDPNGRYTYQGIKSTVYASVDPKAFIPMPFLGAEDLKVYGEVALLGWKNYSYMYEKRTERMPVMAGFNIPAFNVLDVLSIEVEYLNNPFINSIQSPLYQQIPLVYLPAAGAPTVEKAVYDSYQSDARRDNWKWTVFAKKEVTKGIQLYAQAASDHIRTFQINGGPEPALVPITNKNGKEWYYLIRLQFGI